MRTGLLHPDCLLISMPVPWAALGQAHTLGAEYCYTLVGSDTHPGGSTLYLFPTTTTTGVPSAPARCPSAPVQLLRPPEGGPQPSARPRVIVASRRLCLPPGPTSPAACLFAALFGRCRRARMRLLSPFISVVVADPTASCSRAPNVHLKHGACLLSAHSLTIEAPDVR